MTDLLREARIYIILLLIPVIFVLGAIFGYIRWLSALLQFSPIDIFTKINPNPIFLSDIAAFEAILFAFLIPLSIEIVSKISERYQSEVIIKVFEEKWENKWLSRILVVNIVIAIFIRFLVGGHQDSVPWKIVAWILLIFLGIIAYLAFRVIGNIKKYIVSPIHVIDELSNKAKKAFQ